MGIHINWIWFGTQIFENINKARFLVISLLRIDFIIKMKFPMLILLRGSFNSICVLIISPNGAGFETSFPLDYVCTNNQAKYEALLFSLQILQSMEVKHV